MNWDFWNLWKTRNISKLFSRIIIFVTLLTSLLIGSILIKGEFSDYRKRESYQREKYISEQKILIKDLVLSEARFILLRKESMEQDYVNKLKFRVEQAYELAMKTSSLFEGHATNQLKQYLKHTISSLKSEDNFSKIFINSLDGMGVYYPGRPEYENTNLINLKDIHGNSVVKTEIEFLQDKKEGAIFYSENNIIISDTIPVKKVVYLKKIEQLNWYLGGKIYLDDNYDLFKEDIAEKISSVRFKHSGYVFVNHINGDPIVLDGKVYKGDFNFFDGSDSLRHKVFLRQLEAAESIAEGGYFSYEWNKIGETELSPKLSYATYIKELDWVVGAGFYLDDIEKELLDQRQELRKNLSWSIVKIFLVLILVLLIEWGIIYIFDKQYTADLNRFFNFFKKASEEYQKIDADKLYFEELQKTAVAINTMVDAHEEIHKKLAYEQERATQSDKLKTAFLANMSHEIRTPMNAIVGFSEILSHPDFEPSNKKELYNYIKINSHQLLKLIDDIVDIAKIESNQLKVVKTEFDLMKFLEIIEADVLNLLKIDADKKISFYTDYRFPDDFCFNTDEFRLRQVLHNLLNNAVKFTTVGSVILQVSVEKNSILFSVKDTGIGIEEEEQELIFKRFRRSERVSNPKYGGTGLGLAISKHIVELLDGKLQLKSAKEKGAEFYFRLPL